MPTALILGAASDMAVAIAKKFASKGYAVQLAARNVHRLQPLLSDIAIRYNVAATVHDFNALDYDSHQQFVNTLPDLPDVTICVFGYLGENETACADWNECRQIIETNYTGAVSILNIISKKYSAQKKGTIVGISSVA